MAIRCSVLGGSAQMHNSIIPFWGLSSVSTDADGCVFVDVPLKGTNQLVGCIFEFFDNGRINHPALVYPYLEIEIHNDIVMDMYVKTVVEQCYFSDFRRHSSVKDGIIIYIKSELPGNVIDTQVHHAELACNRIDYKLGLQVATKVNPNTPPEGAWDVICPICGELKSLWHACTPLCPYCNRLPELCTCDSNGGGPYCEKCGMERKDCTCICHVCGREFEYCDCK